MGTFNTYGVKSKKYGGSYPVWLTINQKERSGGTLETIPPIGTIIRAGSLVSIDGAGGQAKIIETFEVAENVTATDTTVKVQAYASHLKPRNGINLMKSPTTVGTGGAGVTIAGVALDSANRVFTFTIAANALGTLAKGDILISASKAGTGAKVFAVPSGLTENDVWIEEGDQFATVASVFHGEIMEDRIQPIPDCIKEVLPQIKFQKGI
jgi:hypothetical protein